MAAIFIENFKQLRNSIPILPDLMEDPQRVINRLADMPGIVACEGNQVLGYLTWYLVDEFRGTERKGAYCPEWGHGAVNPIFYRALYRAAAGQWAAAGCEVHAISLLANDQAAREIWFWNGFGLTGVDAIRPITPPGVAAPTGITIRPATLADVEGWVALEIEHSRHYTLPPISMAAHETEDADDFTTFLSQPDNSIWLALDDNTDGNTAIGFIGFQSNSFGAAAIVDAPDKIAITGTYIRPQYRGRRVAAAILDAALRDYESRGFKRCSVDFEAFNPEAAAFWLKYFEPICLSVIRVPERIVQDAGVLISDQKLS
ncbi:MAG TPA: GNAT family N-acetyltransferase [Phototrophicaceae bacterium]|nr:GNAT family N-acetyltransferase [Phototrophicaceae bacterium]